MLPLWALVFLLLVLPKANRCAQAWLIVIPLGLILLVWRMPFALLGVSDGSVETFGVAIASVTMAWSVVWLVGHRLAVRSRIATFFLLLAAMLAVGVYSHYCYFQSADDMPWVLIWCGVSAIILLLAMILTGAMCRRKGYSPPVFCLWLILWMEIVANAAVLCVIVIDMMVNQYSEALVEIAAEMFLPATIMGGFLYLLNLPFLILAFKSPFYQQRFEDIFHLKRRAAACDEQLGDSGQSGLEPSDQQ